MSRDSPVTDSGADEVSSGWSTWSGAQKIGAVAVGIAVVLGVLVVPPFLAADAPAQQEEKRERRQAEPVALDNDPPRDDPSPFTGGGDGRPRKRVAPPPISISTNHGSEQPAASTDRRSAVATVRDGGAGDGGGFRGDGTASDGGANDPHTSLAGQLSGGTPHSVSRGTFGRNPDYKIGSHQHIRCLPTEPKNTRVGGLITCVTDQWVRGDNLRRGLLPPGTVIKGEVKGGAGPFQREVAAQYTRIVTSGDRFEFDMKGIASGPMGQAGLPGDVRTFFGENLGTVAAYAMIQGVSSAIPQAAGAAVNRGSGGLFNFNLGGGTSSLADTVLRHRLNRPPEIERGPAWPEHVTLAVDLDFHSVCRQRQRINPMACPLM